MDHLRSYMSILTNPFEYIQKKISKGWIGYFFFIFNYEKKNPEEQAFISSGILSKKDASRLSEYFKTY